MKKSDMKIGMKVAVHTGEYATIYTIKEIGGRGLDAFLYYRTNDGWAKGGWVHHSSIEVPSVIQLLNRVAELEGDCYMPPYIPPYI